MIIQPDFLDHWKTRALIDALEGDELAPIYLIRLFCFCQNRRQPEAVFDLPPAAIKSICHYRGEAAKLEAALAECRWVERDGENVRVLNWDQHNNGLHANWQNGKKGGRPPKNPQKTHGLPMENPSKTHREPTRQDKKRKEETSSSAQTELSVMGWTKEAGFFGITENDREQWAKAYPACDIDRQLAAANEWLLANPAKAHKKHWRRFITGWLSRAQEKGGDIPSNGSNRSSNTSSRNRGTANEGRESQYGLIG